MFSNLWNTIKWLHLLLRNNIPLSINNFQIVGGNIIKSKIFSQYRNPFHKHSIEKQASFIIE